MTPITFGTGRRGLRFGGPARFSAERGGIAGLYDAHLELGIAEEQRAPFVELFV